MLIPLTLMISPNIIPCNEVGYNYSGQKACSNADKSKKKSGAFSQHLPSNWTFLNWADLQKVGLTCLNSSLPFKTTQRDRKVFL